MANHCSNFLVVNPTNDSDEALAQLRKFVSDAMIIGTRLSKKEATAYRKNYLKENFESKYRDDTDKFIEHSKKPIKDFMRWVAGFSFDVLSQTYKKGEITLSMNNLFPVPSELIERSEKLSEKQAKALIKKYGFTNTYDWKTANWGCRHDLGEDTDVDDNGNSISYTFQTAWSPVTEFIVNICEQYPLLDFFLNYEEPGCNFEGDLEATAGEVTRDETREYSGGDNEDEEFED
jgi:hypothetical protein